jgi:hypothetical protein
MQLIDDLYDIFTLSRWSKRFLSILFAASLVMDVDLNGFPNTCRR